MRNFYYFILLSLFTTPLFAQWTESFEAGIPSTWTVINQGGSNTWIAGLPADENGVPTAAQDGALCAKINFAFSGGHDDYLITAPITVEVGVNGFISLYARNASSSFTDLFDVKVSTTGTAAADFTDVLASNVTPPTAWTNYQYNLNSYAGQTIYVAFQARSQTNNQELDIDLVENFAGPNCPDISNIVVTANTGDTVTLEWTPGATETTWDIEYGITGFTPTGVPTLDNITDNPYTVNGLTSDVTYDFYVRSDCGGTDIGQWVGPFTVTTIINYCAGALFTDTGGVSGEYANNENENWLISPINAGDRVRVTFTQFNTEFNYDFLKVYDGPDNTYPPLHPGIGFHGEMGTDTTVPSTLTSTDPSGSLYFEFTSDTSATRAGWVANVVCEPIPTCPDISQLNASNITGATADVSWVAGAGQTSWSIEYGSVGFTQGSGTVISNVTDNPYTITGLDPITEYSFYVQGECPNSDFSVWAGPSNFETGCATFTPEYTEDFTDMAWDMPPSCWEEYDNGNLSSGPSNLGNSNWTSDGFANVGFDGAAVINLWDVGENDWLVSPVIDLGDGSANYELKFDVATMAFASTEQEGFSDDDKLYIMILNDGTWTVLETFDSTNTPVLFVDHIIPLTGYTGLSRIAFYGTEGTIDDDSDVDVSIDNFIVRVQPTCPQVSMVTVTDITTESATVSWTGASNSVEYQVYYVEAGGDPLTDGTLINPNPTTSPLTIEGLMHSTAYDIYIIADCGAVDGVSAMAGPTRFQTQLPNDDCENAILLTSSPLGESCSTAINGSITGASDSGIEGCVGTADDDVWYTFEAISNRQRITISNIVGSTTDLNFEVFSGADCNNLTSIACSDPLSAIVYDLEVGTTYFVRVFSAGSTAESVTYDICITALLPEADNGTCDTAIEVDSAVLPYTNNQSDYVVASEEGGIIPGCAGGTNDGVWYTIDGNGNEFIITVTPYNGYNVELGVYTSSCEESYTSPVVIACSSVAGTDGAEMVTFQSEIGVTYYINIGHYSSVIDFPEGDFDIEIKQHILSVSDIDSALSNNILYPNPTNGILQYSGEKSIEYAKVYSINGGLVNSKISLTDSGSLDISSLDKGVYIISLQLEDGTNESYKVIKN